MAEHYELLITGGTCVLPVSHAAGWSGSSQVRVQHALVQTGIGIRDGRIATVGVAAGATADEILEVPGLHVLPGLIDPHVHFRDPGDASVESIATGTRGAVLGGISCVFDMPNTVPSITDAASIDAKRAHVGRTAFCDVGIYVGATRGNTPSLGKLERLPGVCGIKLFAGSSTGDLLIEDDAGIEAVMRSGRRRIAFHSEDEYRLQARRQLFRTGDPYASHMAWRDPECAFLGTRRILALARKTGRPAHIVHVSTAEELDFLRGFKDIATVEVLVNHLTQIGPECYEQLGGYAVMNPPIRDRRHFDAAWAAVNAGLVDTIGSDHAPHTRAAKERPWPETAAGLTGVQTAVPIMLGHVNAGRLSLERMVELMAAGPARVYGAQRKGRICAGHDADFTIVDLGREKVIEESSIASPVGWTPFAGKRVMGWPAFTIVRGQVVMREDEVIGAPLGRVVEFAESAGLF
jgi:dihydroorotase